MVFRKIRPYLSGRDTILDYGCGAGHFLEKLLKHGYRAAGLDFSRESVGSVRSRLAARENFLGAFYPEELGRAGLHFDAITVIEVIEHLYDEDLEALLQSVHRIINRDGIVIFRHRTKSSWKKRPSGVHIVRRSFTDGSTFVAGLKPSCDDISKAKALTLWLPSPRTSIASAGGNRKTGVW